MSVTCRRSVVSSRYSGFLHHAVKLTCRHHHHHRLDMTLAVAKALNPNISKPKQDTAPSVSKSLLRACMQRDNFIVHNCDKNKEERDFNDLSGQCYPDYTVVEHKYYCMIKEGNWAATRTACRALGGDLASIHNLGENDVIKNLPW